MRPLTTSQLQMVRKRPTKNQRSIALARAYELWLNELRVKYRAEIGQGIDFLVDDQTGNNLEDIARPEDVIRLRELEQLSLQQLAVNRG